MSGTSTSKSTVRTLRHEQLAAYFMTTQHYTSTQEIYQRFYKDVPTLDAARRSFARDRKSLEALGFSFEMTSDEDDPTLFNVRVREEKSFFTYRLSSLQTKFLSALCKPLLHEESFLWAEDLRYALFKLSGTSQEVLLALKSDGVSQTSENHSEVSSCSNNLLTTQLTHLTSKDMLSRICKAQEQSTLIHARYCTADDKVCTYLFLPIGIFSRYAQTYVVAQKYSLGYIKIYKKSSQLPQETPFDVRVFRLDRFIDIQEVQLYATKSPHIHAEDFHVLPTHIGSENISAQFFVNTRTKKELIRANPQDANEAYFTQVASPLETTHPYLWTCVVHNLDAGMLWCIEEHIIPQGSDQVVEAWERALMQSRKVLCARFEAHQRDGSLSTDCRHTTDVCTQDVQPLFPKRASKGRPSSLTTTRRVITLLSMLKNRGDTISSQEIETMFSCSPQEAQHYLWELLLLSDSSNDFYVPLALTDDDISSGDTLDEAEQISAVSLQISSWERQVVYGKTLQLTLAEVRALTHALKTIGISSAQDITRMLSPHQTPVGTLEHQDDKGGDGSASDVVAAALITITRAIIAHRCISFVYDASPSRSNGIRNVIPSSTFYHNQRWYMRAFDIVAQKWKTYIVANMNQIAIKKEKLNDGILSAPSHAHSNEMYIRVLDKRVLKDLWWPKETTATQDHNGITLCVRGFDPSWLDRRLIAYAHALSTQDTSVTRRLIALIDDMCMQRARIKGL